jgi:hypothetical protein
MAGIQESKKFQRRYTPSTINIVTTMAVSLMLPKDPLSLIDP